MHEVHLIRINDNADKQMKFTLHVTLYTNPKYHNSVGFLYQTKITNWKLVTVHSAQPTDEPVQRIFMMI